MCKQPRNLHSGASACISGKKWGNSSTVIWKSSYDEKPGVSAIKASPTCITPPLEGLGNLPGRQVKIGRQVV